MLSPTYNHSNITFIYLCYELLQHTKYTAIKINSGNKNYGKMCSISNISESAKITGDARKTDEEVKVLYELAKPQDQTKLTFAK